MTGIVTSVKLSGKTIEWLNALYGAGAVDDKAGKATVNLKVRDLVKQIHTELSGGDPAIEAELEKKFDAAVDEAADLNATDPVVLFP